MTKDDSQEGFKGGSNPQQCWCAPKNFGGENNNGHTLDCFALTLMFEGAGGRREKWEVWGRGSQGVNSPGRMESQLGSMPVGRPSCTEERALRLGNVGDMPYLLRDHRDRSRTPVAKGMGQREETEPAGGRVEQRGGWGCGNVEDQALEKDGMEVSALGCREQTPPFPRKVVLEEFPGQQAGRGVLSGDIVVAGFARNKGR